ncbi:MAG: hypothetical protein IJ523_11685 [Succinivibrionaceae bacterium]|nr:hypothetical protein [Succinivibrionaceae bacterium]
MIRWSYAFHGWMSARNARIAALSIMALLLALRVIHFFVYKPPFEGNDRQAGLEYLARYAAGRLISYQPTSGDGVSLDASGASGDNGLFVRLRTGASDSRAGELASSVLTPEKVRKRICGGSKKIYLTQVDAMHVTYLDRSGRPIVRLDLEGC